VKEIQPVLVLKNMSRKPQHISISIALILTILCATSHGGAPTIEVPCSFNPVGSGARAMGMGGAFIGIADDATASSWNPAALIHLKQHELSLVITHDSLIENNQFDYYPESSGKEAISNLKINYLSGAYPYEFLGTNMVLAVSAQRLYSLKRQWQFPFHDQNEIESFTANYTYEQTGDLYAMGLSWCMELLQPRLSLGVSINYWEDGLIGDDWQGRIHLESQGNYNGPYIETRDTIEWNSFDGWNANVGIIWENSEKWRLGVVVKTPFNADVHRKIQKTNSYQSASKTTQPTPESTFYKASLEMPITYGLGILYRCHENFYLAADFYETHWHHFLLRTDGNQTCPLSGQARAEFQLDKTYQVRIGGEYIWTHPVKRRLIPFRFGFFYDPMPSENNGDDVYGFSLGTGWTWLDQFSIDVAYQFRYGNHVGEHYLPHLGFSQDIRESKIYFSLILY